MRKLSKRTLTAVPALMIAFGAANLAAQETEVEQEQEEQPAVTCTAELNPVYVTTGEEALATIVTFSEDIGAVVGLNAPEESGLALADDQTDEVTEMSDETEETEAEEMTVEAITTVIWLNTTHAAAGTYEVVLEGEAGNCNTSIEVKDPEVESTDGVERS